MKKKHIILFFIAFCLFTAVLPAQNRKPDKIRQKYYGKIETLSYQGEGLPYALPYNRWVDPAGEQIYFGDKELENHALD